MAVLLAVGVVPGVGAGVEGAGRLLLPSASVVLLLLCNDREVLGPWANRG